MGAKLYSGPSAIPKSLSHYPRRAGKTSYRSGYDTGSERSEFSPILGRIGEKELGLGKGCI